MNEPIIEVGIMSAPKIKFLLLSPYIYNSKTYEEELFVSVRDGEIFCNDIKCGTEMLFKAVDIYSSTFKLFDVCIGINFHWQRRQDQIFIGNLKFVLKRDKVIAINEVPLETYLESVVSSEMKATASLALLEAHAVISRSWLFFQIKYKKKKRIPADFINTDDRIICWADREDHTDFDVCADDHCQRYEGVTQISSENAVNAVKNTRGEVLTADGDICDARFSKCCGGITERFSTCWEENDYSYLSPVRDVAIPVDIPDLADEDNARKWILSKPESFCNVSDKHILEQVLNDYDQETKDFYRWTVTYNQDSLSTLVANKTNIDFGNIIDMIPIKRAPSGRIVELQIIGTKRACIIGKELEIRSALSDTNLFSSAFVVDKEEKDGELYFILHGAGWGHGVGLCQIGAAVMGAKGYDYKQILRHYYHGSKIIKEY